MKDINDMNLAERVSAMEALWDSLSSDASAMRSPTWHKQVLDKRRQKIASGKATYLSLDQLKEKLAK